MDIAALVNGIVLNGTTSMYLGYSAVASDGIASASWGGGISVQIDATSNQIQTAVLNELKVEAAVWMGKSVPANARIKILGV